MDISRAITLAVPNSDVLTGSLFSLGKCVCLSLSEEASQFIPFAVVPFGAHGQTYTQSGHFVWSEADRLPCSSSQSKLSLARSIIESTSDYQLRVQIVFHFDRFPSNAFAALHLFQFLFNCRLSQSVCCCRSCNSCSQFGSSAERRMTSKEADPTTLSDQKKVQLSGTTATHFGIHYR